MMLFCNLFTERPSYIGILGFYVIEIFYPCPIFCQIVTGSTRFLFYI